MFRKLFHSRTAGRTLFRLLCSVRVIVAINDDAASDFIRRVVFFFFKNKKSREKKTRVITILSPRIVCYYSYYAAYGYGPLAHRPILYRVRSRVISSLYECVERKRRGRKIKIVGGGPCVTVGTSNTAARARNKIRRTRDGFFFRVKRLLGTRK